MALLVVTDPAHERHDPVPGHPERPQRLAAVRAGIDDLHLDTDLHEATPRPATDEELLVVHAPAVVDQVRELHDRGGGRIDADTAVGAESLHAALLAAGSGLVAVERLDAGDADAALCVVRPPGHHATPTRSMGFCLFNNVAVVAASLAARGERVAVVDVDAHHGNGTADVFAGDGRVLFISFHQWPLYPGTGRHDEVGHADGLGTTVNVPVPAGATGDVYLEAFDEVALPALERFAPTWLLVSAGFDAHRADPLTDLGLSAGDFADLGHRLSTVAPPGRRLALLEGGYDLEGLRHGAAALTAGLLGESHRPEPATSGGPGREQVASLAHWWGTVGAELTEQG